MICKDIQLWGKGSTVYTAIDKVKLHYYLGGEIHSFTKNILTFQISKKGTGQGTTVRCPIAANNNKTHKNKGGCCCHTPPLQHIICLKHSLQVLFDRKTYNFLIFCVEIIWRRRGPRKWTMHKSWSETLKDDFWLVHKMLHFALQPFVLLKRRRTQTGDLCNTQTQNEWSLLVWLLNLWSLETAIWQN